MKSTVAELLASRKDDLRWGIYGELLGSLTKDKLKWADAKEVKAVLDGQLEAKLGPRDAQPQAKQDNKEVA